MSDVVVDVLLLDIVLDCVRRELVVSRLVVGDVVVDEDDVDDATHGRSMMVIDLTCVVRVDALHLVEVL